MSHSHHNYSLQEHKLRKLFSVSNQTDPILVTRFLGKESLQVCKKLLAVRPEKVMRRKKWKKIERQLQNFLCFMQTQKKLLHVARKRNKAVYTSSQIYFYIDFY